MSAKTQVVEADGKQSRVVDVSSGALQRSMLCPLLFLLFINNLSKIVKSQRRHFADDALMCVPRKRATEFQKDLKVPHVWANTWQTSFNPKKGFHLVTGKLTHLSNTIFGPYVSGEKLKRVSQTLFGKNRHTKLKLNLNR